MKNLDSTAKKARQILFDTYWSKSGWVEDRSTDDQSFAYAKKHGFMFDPVSISHNAAVELLVQNRNSITREAVAHAFLASLTTRRLEWRSALGSFAFSSCYPAHKIRPERATVLSTGNTWCQVCGTIDFCDVKMTDLNILNFERHKWGGVRHDDTLYAALDLKWLQKKKISQPSEEDEQIFSRILDAVASAPGNATPGDIVRKIAELFQSNSAERRVLIQILGYCGILQPKNKSGYFGEFTIARDREIPPHSKNDWVFPVAWWRGADGINSIAVHHYFPGLR